MELDYQWYLINQSSFPTGQSLMLYLNAIDIYVAVGRIEE